MALTNLKIENLKPKDKLYQVADSEGLVLDIHPTGKKVWRYRYRMPGQKNQEKVTVGEYPIVTLADARLKRAEFKKLISQGISPAKHKQQQKTAIIETNNLTEFSKLWLDKVILPNIKWTRGITGVLDNDILPVLGQHKLQNIEQADVFNVIDLINDRGATSRALLARRVMVQLFDYAIERGKMTVNPAARIKAKNVGKPNSRDRVLSWHELSELMQKLYASTMTHSNKLAVHLLIITAVRKDVLLNAVWGEIDLEAGLWTIPAARMKMKREYVVYLSKQAVKLFSELKQIAGSSDYVLPSRCNSLKSLNPMTLNKAVYKLGLSFNDFVLHDFRRTLSTHLHEAGFNSDVIEKALAHEQKSVRGVYNRAEYAEQRKELFQVWANLVDSLMTDNKVIAFKKAA